MGIIKVCFLLVIFGLAIYLGNATARKYVDRVKELIAIKSALNILENKKLMTILNYTLKVVHKIIISFFVIILITLCYSMT